MVEVTEEDRRLQLRLLGIARENAENRKQGNPIIDPLDLLVTHRQQAAKAERDRLDNIPTNWELTWGPVDDDDGSPCAWLVYRRSGGRSDKEWTLLATGETPTQAITAALEGEQHVD